MKRLGITGLVVLAMSFLGRSAQAQTDSTRADSMHADSTKHVAPPSDTLAPLDVSWESEETGRHHPGFAITSGKAYNRVEGLPILFGPTYDYAAPGLVINSSAFAILRTAGPLHFTPPGGGYDGHVDARFGHAYGRPYAWGIGARLYDVVAPVERWQMTEPDAGLAAFLLRRDYLDYYGRHGASANIGWYGAQYASIVASYSDERWASRSARDPFTLFRNGQDWRANPDMDAGRFHLYTLDATFDTRTNPREPSTGWYLVAQYEYGHSASALRVPRDGVSTPAMRGPVDYGRLFLDFRRYTRISPRTQINTRFVFGGGVNGDELPMERKFSGGGPGTIPGFDFRKVRGDANVQTCSDASPNVSAGTPAMCDRVLLGQLEVRTQLSPYPFGIFNSRLLRLRAAGFTAQPVGVLFADVGRGWRTTEPWPTQYKADVGAGLDLGLFGLYVAKSVSDWPEAANFFIRVRRRF